MRHRLESSVRITLLALLLGAAACDDHIVGQGVPIVNTCLRDPPLTYENTGKGLVERHCRSCHGVWRVGSQRSGAPEGVDFDNEEDVLFWADRIWARTVEQQTMPPAGGMLADERTQFAEWMRCDVFPRIGRVDVAPPTEPEDDTEDGTY